MVVLSSFDSIKETLINSRWNFNSRPLYYSFSLPPGGRNLSFEPFNEKLVYKLLAIKLPRQKIFSNLRKIFIGIAKCLLEVE